MRARRRFANRVGIVTGATGNIGSAIVQALQREGSKLVLSGRRETYEAPAGAIYVPGDVRDDEYCAMLAETAVREFGQIDLLVNAHGVDYHSDPVESAHDEALDVLDVNLLGALLTMKHALPHLEQSGSGAIVNVASRLGTVAIPGQAVYSASKGGLIMLSKGVAIDYAPRGVRVNVVAPGMTSTSMIETWIQSQPDSQEFRKRLVASIPLGRFATTDEVADAVLFLASSEASGITGVVLPVDGGYTAA